MEDTQAPNLEQIREDLKRFPASVLEEFEKSFSVMPETLDEKQLVSWAQAGVEVAEQTVRSWEAAAQYYRASPIVLTFMPFNYFVRWTERVEGPEAQHAPEVHCY